jgi:WD40 repeat protein
VDQQGRGSTVGVWDTTTRASAQTLTSFASPILSVVFSPDGRTFATGGIEGQVWLWEKGTPTPKAELVITERRGWKGVSDLAFSPDGRWLATAGLDHATLWDVATGSPAGNFVGPTEGVTSVAFSPDGRTLAGAGGDGKVCLWDVP